MEKQQFSKGFNKETASINISHFYQVLNRVYFITHFISVSLEMNW